MEESIHERADAYLSNRLSPEEKRAFEREITDNEALAVETARLKEERAAIREAVKDQLKEEVSGYLAEQQQNRLTLRRMAYGVAAAMLILLLSIPFWSSLQTADPAALYAEAFTLPHAPSLRDNTSEANRSWQNALQAYQACQYDKAIAQFSDCLAQNDFAFIGDAYFYRGISHLQLRQSQAAIEDFQSVPSVHLLYYEAQWYQALSYLQAEQIREAKELLSTIAADPNHYAQTQAADLLTKVNQIKK